MILAKLTKSPLSCDLDHPRYPPPVSPHKPLGSPTVKQRTSRQRCLWLYRRDPYVAVDLDRSCCLFRCRSAAEYSPQLASRHRRRDSTVSSLGLVPRSCCRFVLFVRTPPHALARITPPPSF